eukprot:469036_1
MSSEEDSNNKNQVTHVPLKKEPKDNVPYSMKQMMQLSMKSLSDVTNVELEGLMEEIQQLPSYVDENENKIDEDAKIEQAIEIVTTPLTSSTRNVFKPPLSMKSLSDIQISKDWKTEKIIEHIMKIDGLQKYEKLLTNGLKQFNGCNISEISKKDIKK